MPYIIKRLLINTIFFLFIGSLFLTINIQARSGCCSHHGGVCGFSCCDGNTLSDTCLTYYHQCLEINSPYTPVIQSSKTPSVEQSSISSSLTLFV